MQKTAGIIALALSISANVPYIIECVQGKVKPERVSWFIWTLLGTVYFWSALREGGAVLFTTGELIGPVVAFVLSLKYGVGGKSKFDMVMLVLALLAIGWLVVAEQTLFSLVLALVADGIALTLTIRKLHIDPSSESRWAWGIFLISGIFAVISLTSYTLETLAFPIYVIIGSSYIAWRAHPSKKHNANLEKL